MPLLVMYFLEHRKTYPTPIRYRGFSLGRWSVLSVTIRQKSSFSSPPLKPPMANPGTSRQVISNARTWNVCIVTKLSEPKWLFANGPYIDVSMLIIVAGVVHNFNQELSCKIIYIHRYTDLKLHQIKMSHYIWQIPGFKLLKLLGFGHHYISAGI